ncbi:hypothetical protein PGTUg99_037061 [Puccinia graminis f. sp. tritici]|uniref:FAR1 domain-containing protein n=1 Tax=Puccinia graminis f. sp. tritici TaxID=56615 RepID=A0A5B0LXD3_PUCGR|nr:hypothetical protein PGTUg99_037061 [Puccinia graminis f. sp. tritici]
MSYQQNHLGSHPNHSGRGYPSEHPPTHQPTVCADNKGPPPPIRHESRLAIRPSNHAYGANHRSGYGPGPAHQSGTPPPNLPGAPHRAGTHWGTSTQSGPPQANSYHPSLANNYGHPPTTYGSPAQPPANYEGPIRPNNYGQPLANNYGQPQTNNYQPAPPPPNNYGPQPPNNNGPPPAINYGHPPSNYYGSPLTNNDHQQFPNTYGLGPTGNYDSGIYGGFPPNTMRHPMINPIQDPGNNYCIAAGNNYSVLPVANPRAPSVLSQPGHPPNMNTTRVSDNVRNPHSNQDHAHRTNDYNYAATPGSADPHASGHLSHVGPTAQGHLIAPGGRISKYNNDPNCDLGSSGHLTSRHRSPALLPVNPASYTSAFEDGLNPGDKFHELQSSFAANRIGDAGSLILGSNPSLSATFGKAAVDSSLGALIGPTLLDMGSNGQMLDVKVDVRMDEQGDQGGLAEVSGRHEEAPGPEVTIGNPATRADGDIQQDPQTVVLTRAEVDKFDYSIGAPMDDPPLYRFTDADALREFAQRWARSHGYNVPTGKSHGGKNVYLGCSLGGEDRRPAGVARQRESRNRKIGCLYRLSGHHSNSQQFPNATWELRASRSPHNHGPINVKCETVHKRLAPEVQEEVNRLHSLGLKPQAIAQMLNKSNGEFVSLRTIYNTTAAARRAKRGGESPIQFLLRTVQSSNWEHETAYDAKGQLL